MHNSQKEKYREVLQDATEQEEEHKFQLKHFLQKIP